jgi:hypothetical protein
VRLIIVGAIIVIVPLVVLLLLVTLPFSMPVFYSVMCISTTDEVAQITVVSAMPPTTLL